MIRWPVLPLSQLEVLVIDCEATAAAPRGHLLEIAWARSPTTVTSPRAHLIALSEDETIPPAVTRITGLSQAMMRGGVDPRLAWRELADDAARFTAQPTPTVIHFARFEQPFLRMLAGGEPPFDIVCTHDISRRLFPDLPRRSLRALAGYLGRGVGALRRSADHVDATAFLWQELVRRLDGEGVATWSALRDWLAIPADSRKRGRRVWPMPREARLSLPNSPGVYRMLRTSGDVLYVGKARLLHDRVNSHFRKQHGVDERTLEMLSQARAISFDVTSTPLEAALLESDEIKRQRPPYNLALTIEDRAIWFASSDLRGRSPRPSQACPLGPIASVDMLVNSVHSLERTAPLSRQVAGVPMRRRSKRVTSGCAARITNCRASTSRRTPDCSGWAHACGEKVAAIATSMTTKTRPNQIAASPRGRRSWCTSLWSGSRCGRRLRADGRCG